jgi:hypothetical protein
MHSGGTPALFAHRYEFMGESGKKSPHIIVLQNREDCETVPHCVFSQRDGAHTKRVFLGISSDIVD